MKNDGRKLDQNKKKFMFSRNQIERGKGVRVLRRNRKGESKIQRGCDN